MQLLVQMQVGPAAAEIRPAVALAALDEYEEGLAGAVMMELSRLTSAVVTGAAGTLVESGEPQRGERGNGSGDHLQRCGGRVPPPGLTLCLMMAQGGSHRHTWVAKFRIAHANQFRIAHANQLGSKYVHICVYSRTFCRRRVHVLIRVGYICCDHRQKAFWEVLLKQPCLGLVPGLCRAFSGGP